MTGAAIKDNPKRPWMIKKQLMAGQMPFMAESIAQAVAPADAFNCRISIE